MKRASEKLNIYVKNVSEINYDTRKIILSIIFWSFGALALIYVVLLGNMVKNIIQRQGLETQARSFSNEVQSLETTYLSMSNTIDLASAYSMGFKDVKATFATRKTLGFNSSDKSIDGVKIAQNDL